MPGQSNPSGPHRNPLNDAVPRIDQSVLQNFMLKLNAARMFNLNSMTFLKSAATMALMMVLASCGGSRTDSSNSAPPAGDTLASACPEVMELMKQGAESLEKVANEKNFSDSTYLETMNSVVKRLDEIVEGMKTNQQAAPIQAIADAYSKILEETSSGQNLSLSTGQMVGDAVKDLTIQCVASLGGN